MKAVKPLFSPFWIGINGKAGQLVQPEVRRPAQEIKIVVDPGFGFRQKVVIKNDIPLSVLCGTFSGFFVLRRITFRFVLCFCFREESENLSLPRNCVRYEGCLQATLHMEGKAQPEDNALARIPDAKIFLTLSFPAGGNEVFDDVVQKVVARNVQQYGGIVGEQQFASSVRSIGKRPAPHDSVVRFCSKSLHPD